MTCSALEPLHIGKRSLVETFFIAQDASISHGAIAMSFSFPQSRKNLGVSLLFLSELRASICLAFTATNTLAQYFPSFVKGQHYSSLPVGPQVLPGTLSPRAILPQWTQRTSSS